MILARPRCRLAVNHNRHIRLAKTFAREYLRPTDDAVLTVPECSENFNKFCLENGLEPIARRIFKPLIAEVVRELYDMSLRHDVLGHNGPQQNGWKDLAAIEWRN